MIRLFILATIFCNAAAAQTWPTKDCKDVPYIKGNDGIIYHTCNCDTVRKFLCGPLYCPECNHITNEEHMTMLRRETNPDQWNADMEQALREGCPIKDHVREGWVGYGVSWFDTTRTKNEYVNSKLVKTSKMVTSSDKVINKIK